MSPVRQLTTVLVSGLLLAGAAGCTGPRVSQAEIEAAKVISARATPPTRLVTVTPRPAGSAPIVVTASSGRAPTATPVPPDTLLAPAQLRVPTGHRVIVTVNSTDGDGLWVRREPAGDPLRIWPDGSPMMVVGEDEVAEGRLWRQVWTLDGQTGWAAAEYLEEADERALTAAMPSQLQPPAAATRVPGVQARVAGAVATATSVPATATRVPTSTPRPATFPGQGAAPAASSGATTHATATPQPTATSLPTATPVRAPAGATALEVDDATLTVIDSDRAMPLKIGTRPRDGMELAAVQVRITNRGSEPLAVYRGTFRLALADKTRAEPLAGGETPVPYSAIVHPGDALEGWLTFEVPQNAKLDALIWSPDRGTAYALGL